MNKSRQKCILELMNQYNVYALIACNPKHVQYLSGFHTTARPYWQIKQTCTLLTTDGCKKLFVPKPWQEDAHSQTDWEIIEYEDTLEDLAQALNQHLPYLKKKRIVADLTWMNLHLYKVLCNYMHYEIEDEHPILAKCRMIKDPDELNYLKQAVTLLDIGFQTAEKVIKAGALETEVAAQINASMLLAGSEGNGFNTKIISGANGSFPHHMPSPSPIPPKSSTILDFGAIVHNYESDSARTYLQPDTPNEIKEAHEGITHILEDTIAMIHPGMPVKDIEAFIRERLHELAPNAMQAENIGHGVGLHAHEYPDVKQTVDECVCENMVLALEPAIYVPNSFGIRIENMIHIQKNGVQIMNKYPLNRY